MNETSYSPLNDPNSPATVIVLGAGCSVGLGVPTMAQFLDVAFDRFRDKIKKVGHRSKKHSQHLEELTKFIQKIRKSGAYVQARILNMEELYSLADLEKDLLGSSDENKTLSAIKEALFLISKEAGKEFIESDYKIVRNKEHLELVLRESYSQELIKKQRGNRHSTLMAHLGLVSYKDTADKHPMIVSFNWDLALDRALTKWNGRIVNIEDPLPWFPENNINDHEYKSSPLVVRPHGGIHWKKFKKSPGNKWTPLPLVPGSKCSPEEQIYYRRGLCTGPDNMQKLKGPEIEIVPPTWRRAGMLPAYREQWSRFKNGLKTARQLIFIGYSMPRSDLYLRHFLTLALAENDLAPKVYVVLPGLFDDPVLLSNYRDLFLPLANENRLYGLDAYFGNPALLKVERIIQNAKPIRP